MSQLMDISGIMCTVGWPRTHSIKHFSKFIRNGFWGILSTCLYRLILAKRTWTSTLWKNKSKLSTFIDVRRIC